MAASNELQASKKHTDVGFYKVSVVLTACWMVAGYWIFGLWAFSTYSGVFQLVAVMLGSSVALFMILQTDFWRTWFFWLEPRKQHGPRRTALRVGANRAIVGVFCMVVLFALATAAIGGFWSHGVPSHHGNLAWGYTLGYCWNVADAVPFLKIPETLGWKAPVPFSTDLGEWVVIVFRLLAIAPFVTAFALFFES